MIMYTVYMYSLLTIVGSNVRHVLLPQLMGLQQPVYVKNVESISVLGTQGGIECSLFEVSWNLHHSERSPRSIGELFCDKGVL